MIGKLKAQLVVAPIPNPDESIGTGHSCGPNTQGAIIIKMK